MIKYKTVNSLKSPRFSGIKTFMRLQNVVTTEDVDFAVVGIPFDTCATFRVGARFGPSAIRDMSVLACKPYNPVLEVGIFDYCSGVDYGDIGSVPGYVEDSFDVIEEGMSNLFGNGVIPVAMGGDHSVTLPELRACHKTHGPVALIHFDSHYDTIPEYFGKPYSHGTPFYHAAKEGLVDTSKSIQVGIREGLYGEEDNENSKGLGYDVIKAVECHKMTTEEIVNRIKERVGDSKAFLTFDIDFIDPAYAPGTGTPVLGGFSTAQSLEIIRGLKELNIVGYDLVEVAPQYDSANITALAASGIMYEFISHIAYKKKHNIKY
ncbi:MAG: agmatinase [Terrisporobacter sp.]|uniref:agmatinase n=1 Tax=Terrisporobacter sp. TaxID=1965305 RepID=UPI002FC90EC7